MTFVDRGVDNGPNRSALKAITGIFENASEFRVTPVEGGAIVHVNDPQKVKLVKIIADAFPQSDVVDVRYSEIASPSFD